MGGPPLKHTYILGISAYYHDSAAALLEDGEIVAAAQEERFTRIKGDAGFPKNAVDFCLARAGISVDDLDSPGDGVDDTDLGLNLFGGIKFPASSVTPFVEVRAVLEGADQVAITGGILF